MGILENILAKLEQLEHIMQQLLDKQTATASSKAKPEKEKVMLTVKEMAEFLDVSKYCIYKLIQTNEIPYYKPRGQHSKMTYFDRNEVEAWIRCCRYSSKLEIKQQADAYLARKALGL